MTAVPPAQDSTPLLEVDDLRVHFDVRNGLFARPSRVRAVDGVSFNLRAGETLSVVGESGCGKSTLGRAILRLVKPTSGDIRLDGEPLGQLPGRRVWQHRRKLQAVFQDPFASLNPRMRIAATLAEPIVNFGLAGSAREAEAQVAELLAAVGLPAESAGKFPHEFSGGQRQRIGIARALSLKPALIICDEAVSALDVSIQAQIINLLMDLQETYGCAYLFIAHDLAVVDQISHRVAVMYLGEIVELATRDQIFDAPMHPYTEALLASAPTPVPKTARRAVLSGDVPSPISPPPGCRFHTRCPIATEVCRVEKPLLTKRSDGRSVACHLR
jgi:oligopeptide/dipeptide ABC transporter ATP-binding protein